MSNNIHNTAIIDENANIDKSVKIGPYSIIGPNVKIGKDTELESNVIISGDTEIGENCKVFPFTVLANLSTADAILISELPPPYNTRRFFIVFTKTQIASCNERSASSRMCFEDPLSTIFYYNFK